MKGDPPDWLWISLAVSALSVLWLLAQLLSGDALRKVLDCGAFASGFLALTPAISGLAVALPFSRCHCGKRHPMENLSVSARWHVDAGMFTRFTVIADAGDESGKRGALPLIAGLVVIALGAFVVADLDVLVPTTTLSATLMWSFFVGHFLGGRVRCQQAEPRSGKVIVGWDSLPVNDVLNVWGTPPSFLFETRLGAGTPAVVTLGSAFLARYGVQTVDAVAPVSFAIELARGVVEELELRLRREAHNTRQAHRGPKMGGQQACIAELAQTGAVAAAPLILLRAFILPMLMVLGVSGLTTGTAVAQYWRLTGPAVFVPTPVSSDKSEIMLPGTSRRYASGEGLVTTTLNSQTLNSVAFTTTHERYGTNTIAYSWDSPPEILRPGDVLPVTIRWNIGQRYNRFSPQMGSVAHLDWSSDWYTNQCYGELCPGPTTSGEERNTVLGVADNDAAELVFFLDVHATPANVKVQWTYRREEGSAPVLPRTPFATPPANEVDALRAEANAARDRNDLPAAAQAWLKAAELGDASSMFEAGLAYQTGRGVQTDYVEAMRLHRKAADLGNAASMNAIGVLYEEGNGVPKSLEEGFTWYLRSADRNSAVGAYNVGRCYALGLGTSENMKEAQRWMKIAADKGIENAVKWMVKLGAEPAPASSSPEAVAVASDLCSVINGDGVQNNPVYSATPCRLANVSRVTRIFTYHWNDGRGAPPGTIALRDMSSGDLFGPFSAEGSSGQGGAPNVNWTAEVDLMLPAGDYEVLDSDMSTWSWNSASGGYGFSVVTGEDIGVAIVPAPNPGAPSVQPPAHQVGTSSEGTTGAAQPDTTAPGLGPLPSSGRIKLRFF